VPFRDSGITGYDRRFLGLRHDWDEDLLQFRRVDPIGVGFKDDVAARRPFAENKRSLAYGGGLVPGRGIVTLRAYPQTMVSPGEDHTAISACYKKWMVPFLEGTIQ
jgi:hypothetical protein